MVPADIINAKSQGQSKLVVCSWCTIKGNSVLYEQRHTDDHLKSEQDYPIVDTIPNLLQWLKQMSCIVMVRWQKLLEACKSFKISWECISHEYDELFASFPVRAVHFQFLSTCSEGKYKAKDWPNSKSDNIFFLNLLSNINNTCDALAMILLFFIKQTDLDKIFIELMESVQ